MEAGADVVDQAIEAGRHVGRGSDGTGVSEGVETRSEEAKGNGKGRMGEGEGRLGVHTLSTWTAIAPDVPVFTFAVLFSLLTDLQSETPCQPRYA